jgi:type I restriction enzyme S subunit
MEQWKEYRLSELCDILSGGTPKTTESKYWGGGIPWLSVKDFGNVDKYVYTTEKTITNVGFEHCPSKMLQKDDIIISARGTVGAIAMISSSMSFNQSCFGLRGNDLVDKHFLYYLIHTKVRELRSNSHGSVFNTITRNTFDNIICNIPSKVIQHKIATILSFLDDKIELNRKINSNLEEQAKALFKSWFIDFEPFKGGKFVDSELGKIPEGWKVTTIGDVTDNIKDKVGDRDNIKVLSPITSGQLVLSEDYFSKQVFSNSIAKYIAVKHNDFAYNPARINIGSIGMNEFDFDGCVSPVYVVFRCQKGYEYFFDLYRRTTFFTEEVKKRAIGGVRQTLSYKDLSLIQLVYPPKKVINVFNSIYISLLHSIHSNDVSNKKLEVLRDTLLPRLMSGNIEVRS